LSSPWQAISGVRLIPAVPALDIQGNVVRISGEGRKDGSGADRSYLAQWEATVSSSGACSISATATASLWWMAPWNAVSLRLKTDGTRSSRSSQKPLRSYQVSDQLALSAHHCVLKHSRCRSRRIPIVPSACKDANILQGHGMAAVVGRIRECPLSTFNSPCFRTIWSRAAGRLHWLRRQNSWRRQGFLKSRNEAREQSVEPVSAPDSSPVPARRGAAPRPEGGLAISVARSLVS